MTDLQYALPPVDLGPLTRRLAERAENDGLLDLAHRAVDTPIGSLLLVATERGLVTIAFSLQGHEAVLEHLAERLGSRVLPDHRRLDPAARQLDDYFAGRLTAFDLPLDLALSTGYRRGVLERLVGVSFGQTVSYAQLAAATGNPKASRAVGSACATNPIPIVVPCHRVLRSDGTLGGYAGGLDVKRFLLDLEHPALV